MLKLKPCTVLQAEEGLSSSRSGNEELDLPALRRMSQGGCSEFSSVALKLRRFVGRWAQTVLRAPSALNVAPIAHQGVPYPYGVHRSARIMTTRLPTLLTASPVQLLSRRKTKGGLALKPFHGPRL